MTEHDKGSGRAKKLCLALSNRHNSSNARYQSKESGDFAVITNLAKTVS